MTLNIKDVETGRPARELALRTGESLTTAVATALRERLDRLPGQPDAPGLAEELTAIALRCARLPQRHNRPEDEILGDDAHGLPV